MKQAVRSALRKAARGIESDSMEMVLNRYTPTKKDLSGAYEVRVDARQSEPIDEYRATVGARLRRYSLMRFEPKQTATGVTIRIKKGGGKKLIKHAFIAQVDNPRSGESTHVFIRKKVFKPGITSYRRGKYRSEFPIELLRNLRLAGVVEKQSPELIPEVGSRFTESFDKAWQAELGKHGLRGE